MVDVTSWARDIPKTRGEFERSAREWNDAINTTLRQAKDSFDDSMKMHFRREAEALRREYEHWLQRADRF